MGETLFFFGLFKKVLYLKTFFIQKLFFYSKSSLFKNFFYKYSEFKKKLK
jgi:hypothetical protein